jgi:4-hydroxy-tetrahydrodipicolinate reductase
VAADAGGTPGVGRRSDRLDTGQAPLGRRYADYRDAMTRVAVLGAGGRMGATVCGAVLSAPDLELVAAVDPSAAGRTLDEAVGSRGSGITIEASVEALATSSAEVAVDFTEATAALSNLEWCAGHGVHSVCGTTGFGEIELTLLKELFDQGGPNCVLAANFSIGAVLMMRCAEICAPHVDGVEVIELHHEHKRDSPSGTSLETVRRMQQVRDASGAGAWSSDPTETEVLPGARGARTAAGVHLHSVRLRGLVAHQEVIFGSTGESLSIRHDSYDRSCFMPGVLLAVRNVAGLPGLTVGLEALLGL